MIHSLGGIAGPIIGDLCSSVYSPLVFPALPPVITSLMTVKLNNDLCLVYNAANQVYCPGLHPQCHTCSSSVSLLLQTSCVM